MAVDLDFLLGECGIRQLHARYADAVWRFDYDAFGDCFAEDCEWRMDGVELGELQARVCRQEPTYGLWVFESQGARAEQETSIAIRSAVIDSCPGPLE